MGLLKYFRLLLNRKNVRHNINNIIEEKYRGYRPRHLRNLGFYHYSIWEKIGDRRFLEFLKEQPEPPKYEFNITT